MQRGFVEIIVIIVVLVLAAVGTAYYFGFDHGFEKSSSLHEANASPTNAPSGKTYTDSRLKFRFDLPQDWKATPNDTKEYQDYFNSADNEDEYSGSYEYISLSKTNIEDPSSFSPLDIVIDGYLPKRSTLEKQAGRYGYEYPGIPPTIEQQSTNFLPNFYYLISNSGELRHAVIPIPNNHEFFIIFRVSDKEEISTFDQILSTFRFIE